MQASHDKKIKIHAKSGTQYLLKDAEGNYAPENITLKRVGNDLEITQQGDSEPSVTIEGYFSIPAENAPEIVGVAEDGQIYQYVMLSAQGADSGLLMADGQIAVAALGGEALGPATTFVSEESGSNLYPLLGLLAAAGAIGGGAAIVKHNRDNDDDHHSSAAPVSKGVSKVLDNTGEIRGEIKDGDKTDETRPQLSGTGDAGNTITIYDNGNKIGETTVDSNGNWSWTPDAPLGEGSHSITTKETDQSGKVGDASPGFTVIVDTTPPDAPAKAPTATDNVGEKTGPLNPGDSTDDSQPVLSGTGEPGNTIDILDNGKKVGSTTVDKDGNWSWQPDAPLTEGEHNLTSTETDPVGNTSQPSPGLTVNVDTTAPEAPTKAPTATDNVGDKTGPLNPGDSTDDSQPILSGTGEPGNTIDVLDNGKKVGSTTVDKDGNWTWQPDAPLTEGEHNLTTTESDPAGNTSPPSPGLTINVDTTAPDAPTKAPTATDNVGDKTGPLKPGDSTDDSQPVLSGTGEPGNTIDVLDNGNKIGETTVDPDGNWTWQPDAPLTEGEHNLTTTESDPSGNTSPPSPGLTVNVDTTAPDAPANAPTATDNVGDKTGPLKPGDSTDDSQPVLSGTGEPGNTVNVLDNGNKIGETTVDPDGNWTWQPDAPLGEGEHNLTTTESDQAGNTSQPSPGINIDVDTTPPSQDALSI
ncbi:TPA: Biofilm associated protein A, partial [Enterobacter cloacae]|nr:Biofilm associated protein A [Enterobacter cloacae]